MYSAVRMMLPEKLLCDNLSAATTKIVDGDMGISHQISYSAETSYFAK